MNNNYEKVEAILPNKVKRVVTKKKNSDIAYWNMNTKKKQVCVKGITYEHDGVMHFTPLKNTHLTTILRAMELKRVSRVKPQTPREDELWKEARRIVRKENIMKALEILGDSIALPDGRNRKLIMKSAKTGYIILDGVHKRFVVRNGNIVFLDRQTQIWFQQKKQ